MENFSPQHNPKRWIMGGFALTIPTLLFWGTVAYSFLTHNHMYVDEMLSLGGTYSRVLLGAILPLASFALALVCRIGLRKQAIARNVWHRDTPEMKVNQNLINWCVILISVMFLSLINN
ncbi:MAG TPA: hypothetical protein VE978_10450 [Chitinophagales bacterium]|nr:hypothetical protein [Chitinophagales bacterium]